jgi:hypothetical protein
MAELGIPKLTSNDVQRILRERGEDEKTVWTKVDPNSVVNPPEDD